MLATPVSCICATYARTDLLEEAIHSFLMQDYAGPKELVVLNDFADQTLRFDHPEVRIINSPSRFPTLGEKMNAAVAFASHDLLFVWDDDDIYLPHRIRFCVERFDWGKGFFKPDRAWVWNDGRIDGISRNLFHSSSCWSRQRFDAVAGYPAEGTGQDYVFETRLEQAQPGCALPMPIAPEDVYYIYRWSGTGCYHMSQFGPYVAGANVGHWQVESMVQRQLAMGKVRTGNIDLVPRWRADYASMARAVSSLPDPPVY